MRYELMRIFQLYETALTRMKIEKRRLDACRKRENSMKFRDAESRKGCHAAHNIPTVCLFRRTCPLGLLAREPLELSTLEIASSGHAMAETMCTPVRPSTHELARTKFYNPSEPPVVRCDFPRRLSLSGSLCTLFIERPQQLPLWFL